MSPFLYTSGAPSCTLPVLPYMTGRTTSRKSTVFGPPRYIIAYIIMALISKDVTIKIKKLFFFFYLLSLVKLFQLRVKLYA